MCKAASGLSIGRETLAFSSRRPLTGDQVNVGPILGRVDEPRQAVDNSQHQFQGVIVVWRGRGVPTVTGIAKTVRAAGAA